ncbi:beta-hydroxyacyl-ACP dehydratase [Parabacteroides bouchesdurhonensis]|uniref:beta-hydroxyacyl-ACP dehydratase n=1 Tax=Parabacteroides bouchesdurhonensis TaxID=1936995 RepID=UPI000E5388A8|nr:beta-hydroxyacyl-ACP dehydratase [Parabacteroides bouchesdurhonensis]RHJ93491.1 beta-hydroxyacyl-ACP dehydratase [Bacteroides sp. AM07-16]
MKLENNYYKLISMHHEGLSGRFHIALRKECDVYIGHFPGDPVSPGACNIQTIKECAERLVGKRLRISTIRQCRLRAVATPVVCPELDVIINLQSLEQGYAVTARIIDAEKTYMEYKGEMTV